MSERRIICGIDPGLASLGWGVVSVEGTRLGFLGCGTLRTGPRSPMAERLLAIHRHLSDILDRFGPASAAVEETFVNKDQRTALVLAQARGVALLVPAQKGLPVSEYAPNLIKKSVVGNGHAGKDQVRMMVGVLLPGAEIDSDHAADALAIAITHAHLAETSARWRDLEAKIK